MTRTRFFTALTVLSIAVVALSACSRRAGPAPLDDRSSLFFGRGTAVPIARPASERPPISKAAALFTTPGSVTVQPGDTLYALSRRNTVPIRAIINANNIAPPYVLRVGQKLTLPRQAYHQVTNGDSVASIARAYGVSSQELVRLNDIDPPYVIYVGQPILLPTTPGGQTVASNASVLVNTANQPNQPQAAPNQAGNQRLGGGGAGNNTVTSVSPNAAGATGGNLPQSSVTGPNPQTGQSAPPALTVPNSPNLPAGPSSDVASLPSPAAPPPPEAPIAAPPVTASGNAFTWPVQGSVISGYGPKEGGLYNEGINIAVPQGTPVRAAQDGEVAYVGNELRGYGNLLLVRHPNGWVTAYAHNQQLLVQRGDKVKRGQIIAHSGATGSVDSPQVHFELRQGTRSVDPTRYLGGQGVTDRGGVDLANGG